MGAITAGKVREATREDMLTLNFNEQQLSALRAEAKKMGYVTIPDCPGAHASGPWKEEQIDCPDMLKIPENLLG